MRYRDGASEEEERMPRWPGAAPFKSLPSINRARTRTTEATEKRHGIILKSDAAAAFRAQISHQRVNA